MICLISLTFENGCCGLGMWFSDRNALPSKSEVLKSVPRAESVEKYCTYHARRLGRELSRPSARTINMRTKLDV